MFLEESHRRRDTMTWGIFIIRYSVYEKSDDVFHPSLSLCLTLCSAFAVMQRAPSFNPVLVTDSRHFINPFGVIASLYKNTI